MIDIDETIERWVREAGQIGEVTVEHGIQWASRRQEHIIDGERADELAVEGARAAATIALRAQALMDAIAGRGEEER